MKNEKRGNGKNKKIIIGVASIVAIAAVAVPTALTLANGNENAGASNTKKFSITICSGIDSIQDYNLTVSEGTKISELKSILKAIDGYKIEGIFRDEGMNHEFLDYETIKSYTKIFIKFVAVTYKVNIFDENRNFIETKEVSHNSGLFLDNPTKPADDFAEYEFTGWVNDMGKSVNITNIVSDLNIYPSFKSVMNEYKIGFVNSNNINNVLISVGGEPVTLETIYHYGATIKIKAVEMSGKKISEFKVIVGNYEAINILSEEYKKEENGLDCYEIEFKGKGDVSIIYSEAASEYNIGQIPDGVTVYSENRKISSNDIVKHGEQLTITYSVKEDYVLDKFEISGAVHISDNIYEVRSDINIIFECLYAYSYLNFEKTSDGYKVTGLNIQDTKVVVIPNTYNGENVTEIAEAAFKGNEITSLTIGENVKRFGSEAFMDCTSLIELYFNAIEAEAFANFETMEFKNVFTNIGQSTTGVDVVFGDNVKIVPAGIFVGFDNEQENPIPVNIATVKTGKNLKEIGYGAFALSNLKSIELEEGLIIISEYAFDNCNNLTSIIIPNSVTEIGKAAFNECYNLVSVKLSENVTTLYDHVFRHCNSLESITVPKNLTSIGTSTFFDCWNLKTVTIESEEIYKQTSYNTSYSLLGSLLNYASTVRVPANIVAKEVSVYLSRFATSEDGDYVVFDLTTPAPDHEYLTFTECEGGLEVSGFNGSVTDVVIPSAYKGKKVVGIKDRIDGGVFGNSSITSVIIREGVEKIGRGAFINCLNLTNVSIPNSIIEIELDSFDNCNNIECINDGNAYYFGNNKNKYLVLKRFYNKDADTYEINSNCKVILGYAFKESNIRSVTIPNSVKDIGFCAFWNCMYLSSVVIPEGITKLKDQLFIGCYNLRSVTLPSTLKIIEGWIFNGCNNLKSIIIPSSVIKIYGGAFAHSGLDSIIFENTNGWKKGDVSIDVSNPEQNATLLKQPFDEDLLTRG